MTLLRLALLLACMWPISASSFGENPMEIHQMLIWDDPNRPDTVAGYIIYQRTGVDWKIVGKTDQIGFPITVSATVETYAVSCIDVLGIESARSNEVNVRWAPLTARRSP